MANNPNAIANLRPFKPGQSGNPAGKPKGVKHINTWVQELMHDEEFEALIYDAKVGIKEFKGAPLKAIIKAQMIKALNGDTKAYDSLVRSGWAQKVETDVTTKGESLNTTIDPAAAAAYAEYLKGK